MDLPIDEQLLKDALSKWGTDSQKLVAIEECGELISALAQSYRVDKTPNVISEIADVLITVSQLRLMYGTEAVDEEIKRKLERVRPKIYG